MTIIEGEKDFQTIKNAVVTIGTFDGVHIGHQKILKRVTTLAAKKGGESVLVTFWPHPRFILRPDDDSLKLLTTFEEKAALMESVGLHHIVKIPFTHEFSQLTSEAFTRQVLVNKIGTKHLVIGYDHRFGKNREGGFEELKANESRFGFKVEEIPKQEIDDVSISSTKIRNALLSGDISHANTYLGRNYSFIGTVVEGAKLGRRIGFPTANLAIKEKYKLIPADGAYAVLATISGNTHRGMMNIGIRPTVNGTGRTIEVHIFDFKEEIYNYKMEIALVAKIRPETKFTSLDVLKEQLIRDKAKAIELLP